MYVPVGLITLITPDNLFSTSGLPVREASREDVNRVNQTRAIGAINDYEYHDRVAGAGVPHNEYRGESLPGELLVTMIRELLPVWMVEGVRIGESIQSGLRVQFKFRCPNADLSGMWTGDKLETVLNCLALRTLNIRGVWENDQDRGKFVTLIMGPDHVKGSPTKLKIVRIKSRAGFYVEL